MEFKEALKEILIIRGSSALKDETTLKLLDDYGAFDEHPAFRSLMKTVISAKIGEMLQDTFYFLVKDKGQAWKQMKNKLMEMMPYDKVIMESEEVFSIKCKIKALMAERGYTLERLAIALKEKYNVKESKNNLSNKLSRGTLKYIEVKRIADILDFDINFVSRKG